MSTTEAHQLTAMLRHLRSYRDSWVATFGEKHSRNRLCLDFGCCLLMQAVAMHLYGQRIDELTCGNDAQLSATASGWQPCTTSSTLLRTAFRVLSLRSSLAEIAKNTQPGGSMPTELMLLALYTSPILMICMISIAPVFWLRRRSYIMMLAIVACNLVSFSSLITHPGSEPCQHWTNLLPITGAFSVWQQCMFRFDIVPGLINAVANFLFGVAGMIFVPMVYPDLTIPSYTLPLLVGGLPICMYLCYAMNPVQQQSPQQQVSSRQHLKSDKLQLGHPGSASTSCSDGKPGAMPHKGDADLARTCAGDYNSLSLFGVKNEAVSTLTAPVVVEKRQQQQQQQEEVNNLGKNSKFVSVGPMFTIYTQLYDINLHQLPSNFLSTLSDSLTSGPGPHFMIMSAAIRQPCMELVVDVMQMDGTLHPDSNDLGGFNQAEGRTNKTPPYVPPPAWLSRIGEQLRSQAIQKLFDE